MKDLLLKYQRGEISHKDLKEGLYPDLIRARGKKESRDVVMYSYRWNTHEHINTHEINRIIHSVKSLRKFNKTIPIYLFCSGTFKHQEDLLVEEYGVKIRQFEKFDHDMLNSWSIHRWYNLKYFHDRTMGVRNQDYSILYVDSDTIFYDDVQYIFDTYCTYDVYGREEIGFRHCPITGSNKNIRFSLDVVDAAIYASGGRSHVYKYCTGVMLLNNNLHVKITDRINWLTRIMKQLQEGTAINPMPNPRILDQYGVWLLLSRLNTTCGLFGIQDVTHSYLEAKHQEYFNPVVLHYTTKDEQEFAKSNKKYHNLIRDTEDLGPEIDPYY
jgi:hypothetical protein